MRKKEVTLHRRTVSYALRRSRTAKKMRIAIYCDGSCVVTAPHSMHGSLIEKFLVEKGRWILEKLEYFSKIPSSAWAKGNEADYAKYKDAAYALAVERVAFFNKRYGFEFNSIAIKNQKTRWGSCSRKGNLNFNYKVALLPQRLSDYIFVHELCHVGQFNHSKKFWALVEKAIPDYRDIREELKVGKVS